MLELVEIWFSTDAGEPRLLDVHSLMSSVDEWSGERCCGRIGSSLAWSGCRRTLEGRRGIRALCESVGDPAGEIASIPGMHTIAFGDGDACTESMPESACRKSLNAESRRSCSMSTSCSVTVGGNMKLWPSASPRGESFVKRNGLESRREAGKDMQMGRESPH